MKKCNHKRIPYINGEYYEGICSLCGCAMRLHMWPTIKNGRHDYGFTWVSRTEYYTRLNKLKAVINS